MYIGLSEDIEKRWYDHMHSPSIKYSRIDRAIRKHGVDKFDLEIIEELPNDRTLLMKREEYWVAHYNTYEDDFHYNLTPGGDFAPSKLPEVQAKMSKALSGENHPMYGCKHTPEAKAKISKSVSGKNHPMYGKKHTQEIREKMSKAKSGKKLSQKTRKKYQKHNLGKIIICMVKNIHKKSEKKCQKHAILLDIIMFINVTTKLVNKVFYGLIHIMRIKNKKQLLALISKNLKKKSEQKD